MIAPHKDKGGKTHAQIHADARRHRSDRDDRNRGNGTDVDFADRPRILEALLHHCAGKGPVPGRPDADAAPSSQPPRQWLPLAQRRSVGGGDRGRDHQEPRVLKTGEFVYIPRGTIHRNENKSTAPTRTIELLIKDKDKPQNMPAPAN
jgi:hypothetical protein